MSRKILLIGTVFFTAVGLSVGCYWHFRNGKDVLRLPGVVEIHETRLGSKIGGRVAEIKVNEGDSIEAGQILVRFEAPELEAQRTQQQAKLRQAEAAFEKAKNGARPEELDAIRSAMEAARARWQKLKTGWREEEIRQALNELKAAEADFQLAQQEFDRAEKLYKKNAIAKAEFDNARSGLDRGLGRRDAAKARLDMFNAGSRIEEVTEAASELARAKANYDLLKAGTRSEELQEAEAKVAEARGKLQEIDANLEETLVRAPGKGVVEVLAVRKGDLVPPNQPVIRILCGEDMWVKVYVPETQLGKVQDKQAVELEVDSYPGRRFHGTVIQIANESEFTPRNVQSVDERRYQVFGLKVRVDDLVGIFKSGMAAEVWLPLQQ